MKQCKECKETKSLVDFPKHSNMSDGYLNTCKVCKTNYTNNWAKDNKIKTRKYKKKWSDSNPENNKEYREKNKEKIAQLKKEWAQINSDRKKVQERTWVLKNANRIRNNKWKRNYNITAEDYFKLLESQQNVCYICHKKEENKFLAVDHCHRTNKVRGLLCGKCNKGIGLFNDDTNLLEKAIHYLRRDK